MLTPLIASHDPAAPWLIGIIAIRMIHVVGSALAYVRDDARRDNDLRHVGSSW